MTTVLDSVECVHGRKQPCSLYLLLPTVTVDFGYIDLLLKTRLCRQSKPIALLVPFAVLSVPLFFRTDRLLRCKNTWI